MYDISFANLMLYGSTVPDMGGGTKDGRKEIDAADPENDALIDRMLNEN